MPILERACKPSLHHEIDDFTDPWRNAPVLILQHGYGRSSLFCHCRVPHRVQLDPVHAAGGVRDQRAALRRPARRRALPRVSALREA